MSDIRFITSSDEHLADLNPGFRKDKYRDAVLRKIEWQGEIASKVKATAVLRGGDMWHIKAANKNTHATSSLLADIHRKYPCPTYSCVGNHDMSMNDINTALTKQPISTFFKSGVFNRLTDQIFENGSLRVRVVGVDYTTDLGLGGLQDLVRKKPGTDYTIAFVHALAAMAPEERIQSFFNETIFDYRDLVFEGCPDAFLFGHYHKDQGIVDHLGIKFINLGAISRGALTFENLDRIPKISYIKCSSQGISVESINIPCEDAAKVFDLERKKKLEYERKSLDGFINQLKANATMASMDSLEMRKQTLGQFPEDLRHLVLEILESSRAGTLVDP